MKSRAERSFNKQNSPHPRNRVGKNEKKSAVQFMDNRPKGQLQKEIQLMANHFVSQKPSPITQRKPNNTGLPDKLKSGIENLSGYSMDDVKVHYNSDKPAQLNAHAYAQGNAIHLASGQEKHLPHEAWHIVQQKQGRVQPTMQMKSGININDNSNLETEADIMGSKAVSLVQRKDEISNQALNVKNNQDVLQLRKVTGPNGQTEIEYHNVNTNGLGTKVEADIYPNDIPPGKSPPKSRPSWWEDFKQISPEIKDYVENYLVQGHLLNHHIGGEDNMDNLTPITASTNTTMLNQYEAVVKNEVINKGNRVVYVIEADYSAPPNYKELGIEKQILNQLSPQDRSDFNSFLNFLCGSIVAYYDVYDSGQTNIDTASDYLWTKNEGAHLKGTF